MPSGRCFLPPCHPFPPDVRVGLAASCCFLRPWASASDGEGCFASRSCRLPGRPPSLNADAGWAGGAPGGLLKEAQPDASTQTAERTHERASGRCMTYWIPSEVKKECGWASALRHDPCNHRTRGKISRKPPANVPVAPPNFWYMPVTFQARPQKELRSRVCAAEGERGGAQVLVVGTEWGRVRSLVNDAGEHVDAAVPGDAVEVFGLRGVPQAGDDMTVVASEERARRISEARSLRADQFRFSRMATAQRKRAQLAQAQAALTDSADAPGEAAASSHLVTLAVKADVQVRCALLQTLAPPRPASSCSDVLP